MKRIALVIGIIALVTAAAIAWSWAGAQRNVTYLSVSNVAGGAVTGKLDLYLHLGSLRRPTLLYIHGGGWSPNSGKAQVKVWHLPFLYLGWNFVNVEYRRTDQGLAPAAAEDCACALRWVAAHADQYHFDPDRVVLMGDSAGGTLALLTGLAPATAGFDHDCPTAEPPKVAAVIDWAGVVDLAPLREGPAPKGYALSWIGDQPNADAVTNLVSPIHYVRPGLPPVFIVHADHDPVVPYAQAVMLRDALDQAGDPNTLLTLANSTVHTSPGQLTALRVDLAALTFLATHGVRLLP